MNDDDTLRAERRAEALAMFHALTQIGAVMSKPPQKPKRRWWKLRRWL